MCGVYCELLVGIHSTRSEGDTRLAVPTGRPCYARRKILPCWPVFSFFLCVSQHLGDGGNLNNFLVAIFLNPHTRVCI